QVEEDQLDLNGHTPLDIVWKLLNNLVYEFEYREETLKLMLSHKCKCSSLKSLTEFYTNSNRNYQDTVMEDDKFDRHYTGSILRNLIHVMYENE
ncbi:unnamed protein product, partial [Rotaria sordida]